MTLRYNASRDEAAAKASKMSDAFVEMSVTFVAMFVTFVAMFVTFVAMLVTFVAMLVTFVAMLVTFVVMFEIKRLSLFFWLFYLLPTFRAPLSRLLIAQR